MQVKIRTILFLALTVRLLLFVYQYNVGNLPQAGADSVRFERVAYEISMGTSGRTFSKAFTQDNAYIHCFIGASIYSIFGRVPELWALLHLFLGIIVVYNIYRAVLISTESYKIANRSALIASLFPNFAIFSVILLREIYIHFFISLAAVSLIKFLKYNKLSSIIYFLLFGVLGSIFHSAVFSILLGFILYTAFLRGKVSWLYKVFVIVFSIAIFAYINYIGVGLSKFGGSFENALDMAMGEQGVYEHAGSNYPNWMVSKGGVYAMLLLPVRIVAFLFAPLIPFMVRNLKHIIGIIDSICYLLILINIVRAWFYHRKSDYSKALLTIVLAFVMVFSFGASNFGTNIRHRAKVLPVLLSIPLITKKERYILKHI